jgi:hypothetical protein
MPKLMRLLAVTDAHRFHAVGGLFGRSAKFFDQIGRPAHVFDVAGARMVVRGRDHDVLRDRAAVEVVDRASLGGVDAEMVVDRGEEIVAGVAGALDHVFAAFVAGTDDAAGLDAATGPEIGEGTRPVIAAGLQRASGPLASPAPVLRSKLIFGVRPNSPVTTTSTRLVEPTRVNVLDQGGNGRS